MGVLGLSMCHRCLQLHPWITAILITVQHRVTAAAQVQVDGANCHSGLECDIKNYDADHTCFPTFTCASIFSVSHKQPISQTLGPAGLCLPGCVSQICAQQWDSSEHRCLWCLLNLIQHQGQHYRKHICNTSSETERRMTWMDEDCYGNSAEAHEKPMITLYVCSSLCCLVHLSSAIRVILQLHFIHCTYAKIQVPQETIPCAVFHCVHSNLLLILSKVSNSCCCLLLQS